VSAAQPIDYGDRCQRYARQRGWAYDPERLSIGHLTPRQRRRAMHKEGRGYGDAPEVVAAGRQRARKAERLAAVNRRRAAAGLDPLGHDYDADPPYLGLDGYDLDYYDHGGYDPHDLGYCVTPGCTCCGDD
jgi:hypothetical protein